MCRDTGGVELNLKTISEALDQYVRPQTFPVAIGLIDSAGGIPGRARMPKRDLGFPIALCQGVALARRYGWLVALSNEDMLCPLGALALGFVPAKEKFLDGSFGVPFWVKDQSVRAKMAQALPRLETGKYSHILAAPINRADFEPQVIVIYGNPAQIARLIQAAIYASGEPVASSSYGGFACAEEITRPIMTQQCRFIVTGGGDRAIAQAHDDEMSFAMPMSRAKEMVDGLEATHKAGMRYPTPSFLTFKADFPVVFDQLTKYLRQDN